MKQDKENSNFNIEVNNEKSETFNNEVDIENEKIETITEKVEVNDENIVVDNEKVEINRESSETITKIEAANESDIKVSYDNINQTENKPQGICYIN